MTVELVEDTALPKMKGRQQINTALEEFYNTRVQVNTHVPYYWWQGRTPVVLPEPEKKKVSGDIASVPEATRRLVIEKISSIGWAAGERQRPVGQRSGHGQPDDDGAGGLAGERVRPAHR